MRMLNRFVCVLLLLVTVSFDASPRYPWLTDLDKASQQAESSGKPLLIVFRCVP